jgi:TPP-dependent pyruvate/acetoin dehydrogenase alpha subunit
MRGRDPVRRLRDRLLADSEQLEELERQIDQQVTASVESAVDSLAEVPA